MFQRSRPRFRSALTSAAVIALLVLSAGSAAAATGPAPDAMFTQNGKSADASSGGCASNGNGTSTCSDVGISVFVGKMSDGVSGVIHANQVCVILDNYTSTIRRVRSWAIMYPRMAAGSICRTGRSSSGAG